MPHNARVTPPDSYDLCVIGLGYIGLPTAALAAATGLRVLGVDVDLAVLDAVNDGAPHFPEPGLDALVAEQVDSGRLTALPCPSASRIYLIAVPTPFLADKAPDLSHVRDAANEISITLKADDLVILESTSPPRTTLDVVRPILELGSGLIAGRDFHLAYCPERVLPGRIMIELKANDRLVGGIDAASSEAAATFYGRFVEGQIHRTDATTAETVKLVENAFRDVNIAFANEVSLIAARLKLDVWEVIALANRHPRVNVLQPGVGVGGHCIGVDPWFLVDAAPEDANLIRTARKVNQHKAEWVTDQICDAALESGAKSIGLLGATYKPDVADIRESPALDIARQVTRRALGRVLVAEPHRDTLEGVTLAPLDQVLACDLIAILVPHTAFRSLPPETWVGKRVLDYVGMLRS